VDDSDLSPAELFSVCASAADAACWQEFIRRFNPLIARSALRIAMRYGCTEKSVIDDLVQETYLKLCANECRLLRTFTAQSPESPFGFLKVVAVSVAQDFFKSRLAEKRAPEATATSIEATLDSPREEAQGVLSRAERAVLVDQIDRKLRALVPAREVQRARTVFWLYYRSGFTANAIASIPAVDLTTKGVESLLFRLTRLVRDSLSRPGASGAGSKKGFQEAESF